MNVRDLIAALSQFDPDYDVMVGAQHDCYDYEHIIELRRGEIPHYGSPIIVLDIDGNPWREPVQDWSND